MVILRLAASTGHEFDGTATIVTAQDPERPEYGHLQLKFTGNPVELRQWVVFDGQGARTTVVLGQLELPSELPGSLFSIEFEEAERRGIVELALLLQRPLEPAPAAAPLRQQAVQRLSCASYMKFPFYSQVARLLLAMTAAFVACPAFVTTA